MFPMSGPFYMPHPSSPLMISSQSNPYTNGNLVYQQERTELLQNMPVAIETVHLYVPNAIIGTVIGAKGLFIKSIMKNSNAMIKVIDFASTYICI